MRKGHSLSDRLSGGTIKVLFSFEPVYISKKPLELYQRGTPFGNCGIAFIQMLLLKMPVHVEFNRKQKFQPFLANYIKERFC